MFLVLCAGAFAIVLADFVYAQGQQWILFDLPQRSYFNRHGEPVSIEGRKNRYGRDEFYGGGKLYPSFNRLQVMMRYEHESSLLVLLDGPADKLAELAVKNDPDMVSRAHRVVRFQKGAISIGPPGPTIKERIIYFQEFRPRLLSEAEAAALLEQWGLADHLTIKEEY